MLYAPFCTNFLIHIIYLLIYLPAFCFDRKYRVIGRSRRSVGGAECSHCGLLFDTSTLLDLHTLAHDATGNQYCF